MPIDHNLSSRANPLVSAVIPAFNSHDTILRALQSVWDQDYAPIEVIVIDDASSDDTREIVSAHSPRGVQLIALPSRKGASIARNTGISHARGRYIAFLDADDAWLPTKISKQVRLIECNRRTSLVTCNALRISSDGVHSKRNHDMWPPTSGVHAWKTLLTYNYIPTPSVLARREDLAEAGGFDPNFPVGEDLDLWIRLAIKGEVGVIDDVLVWIHDRPGSLMKSRRNGEVEVVLPMIENHLRQLKHRLSEEDIRSIRARRYFDVGCNLFCEGTYLDSLPLFWRSALLGYRRMKSLSNLPRAFIMACLGLIKK